MFGKLLPSDPQIKGAAGVDESFSTKRREQRQVYEQDSLHDSRKKCYVIKKTCLQRILGRGERKLTFRNWSLDDARNTCTIGTQSPEERESGVGFENQKQRRENQQPSLTKNTEQTRPAKIEKRVPGSQNRADDVFYTRAIDELDIFQSSKPADFDLGHL
ncbi:hypothetical protein C5167_002851 [Papaver somniferum]|uniref:Uncharacterized protein n=1 Tax=Papaver somniferum TaxID=3469 RepID=A0A4Y7L2A7_PAPSO|nr:hypothetical protein C5167_002851 [Papaver somniferum]